MSLEQEVTHVKKVEMKDRLKSAAIPAVITAGAFFWPDIKARYYDTLPEEKQRQYRTYFNIACGAAVGGYLVNALSPKQRTQG